jgi:hypothetical protein
LIGLFLLAVSPWHIMLSRWALDANPLPSLFMAATYFLVSGAGSGKRARLVAASVLYALCLYAYGVAMVVVPVFLALALAYMMVHKKIRVSDLLVCGGAFIAVASPLIVFMAINVFRLPEILGPFFSFSHFTVMRSSSTFRNFKPGFFSQAAASLKDYLSLVVFQKYDGLPWNSIPGFGVFYLFSTVLAAAGAILAFARFRLRSFFAASVFLAWFFAASLAVFLIYPNINRIGIVYIPVIYFCALSLDFLSSRAKIVFPFALAMYMAYFGLFSFDYFTKYPARIGSAFFESFGDAVKAASAMGSERVYVTQRVNGPYILTLFYMKTDPRDFASTVVYDDPKAEFRMARSFGKYVFRIPREKDPSAVYVVSNGEVGEFDPKEFRIIRFRNFSVAYGAR